MMNKRTLLPPGRLGALVLALFVSSNLSIADERNLEKLARLAGARFVLRELVHPGSIPRGTRLDLPMKWSNVGMGKLQFDAPEKDGCYTVSTVQVE